MSRVGQYRKGIKQDRVGQGRARQDMTGRSRTRLGAALQGRKGHGRKMSKQPAMDACKRGDRLVMQVVERADQQACKRGAEQASRKTQQT